MNRYIRKEESTKINNLSFHLLETKKKREREEHIKSKIRKEIIKIRAEISEIENSQKNHQNKSLVL